jgi:type IV pilus assembly protein PilV
MTATRNPLPRRAPRARSLGMSLTEVLVSMAVFAIGVLGLFSAHSMAFTTYSDSKYRVDAALLADQLIGEMWVDRANAALYAFAGGASASQARLTPWLTQVRRTLPGADAVVQVVGTQVQVTVTWQPRNADRRTHTAIATLQEP